MVVATVKVFLLVGFNVPGGHLDMSSDILAEIILTRILPR